MTSAAVYTWDNGGADNLWSTCTNWSSDICPGAGDVARFTSATTDDAFIDSLFAGSVQGIQIDSGYTGTITQQRDITIGTAGFVQGDGTYSQGTTNFQINDASFVMTAGSFTAAAGSNNRIERNFNIGASASLTSSSTRVWEFFGDAIDDTTFTYTGAFPGTVGITKLNANALFTLAGTAILNNVTDLSTNQGRITINSGTTMHVANNVLDGLDLTISGALYASTTIDLRRSFILNSGGEFYFDGTTIFAGGNYTDNGGTFDETGITFVFDGADSDADTIFTFTGVFPGSVDIEKTDVNSSFTLAAGTISIVDLSTSQGPITINAGATMHVADNALNALDFNVSGTLYASSTIDVRRNLTLNPTGEVYYDGNTIFTGANYTDTGATFDETGITFVFDGSTFDDFTTFTYTNGVFPGIVDIDKSGTNGRFTLAAGTISTMADMSTNQGSVVINAGTTMHVGNNVLDALALTISGALYASTTIDLSRDFTLNSGGEFYFDGTTIFAGGNYTDNGGTFDETGITFVFDGGAFDDLTTFTYSGVFPGIVDIDKSGANGRFNLAAGATIFTADTTGNLGQIRIFGTLRTDGNPLVGFFVTVQDGGVLAVYPEQTLTTPTLEVGSTVEYYGPSSYTTIGAYNYSNLAFSAGTYNLTADIAVARNFTNTGAVFNQTAGTTTFSGTANTITGDNTFYNLAKTASAASTLTFAAGDTQTVGGNLTLTGLDAGNRLTLESSTGSSQWLIDPQGSRTIDFISVSDGNNVNTLAINCYEFDCVDGGNNTNISFEPPFPTYRLNGGVRLRGGTRI